MAKPRAQVHSIEKGIGKGNLLGRNMTLGEVGNEGEKKNGRRIKGLIEMEKPPTCMLFFLQPMETSVLKRTGQKCMPINLEN